MDAAANPRVSLISPLAIRNFRNLWIGQSISLVGDQFKFVALSWSVASARPDLGVYEHYFRGLFSEHASLTVAGCRSLAVINFTPDGVLPNWHRPSDTVANIDVSVLDRTEQFVWELLHHLDRQGWAQKAFCR